MKKLLAIILTGCLMCGALVGCGGEKTEDAPSADTQTQDVAPPTEPEPELTPTVYPERAESIIPDFDQIGEEPEIIYTTPAEENGLGNTMYKIIGTVEKYVSETDSEYGIDYAIIKTDKGKIAVLSALSAMPDSYDSMAVDKEKLYSYFQFPKEGEYVCFYVQYMGFSESMQCAAAYYGGEFYLTYAILQSTSQAAEPQTEAEPDQDAESEEVQGQLEPINDNTLSELKSDLEWAIGEDESITDISLDGKTLKINVNISSADLNGLTAKDLAYTRTSSITDKILEHNELDTVWDNIILDFGSVGSIKLGKDAIKTNEYGMRYMDSAKFHI